MQKVKETDYYIKVLHAPVAQWIEQPPSKRSVERSNRFGRALRKGLSDSFDKSDQVIGIVNGSSSLS